MIVIGSRGSQLALWQARHVASKLGVETRIETSPGDYVYVPPYAPHREENPSADEEAVVVIARSTQEAIVVNLPGLTGAG